MKTARNFFQLPVKTEVGIMGYSGGAHIKAWVCNLAQRYAPDVNIIGAIYGGTPIDTRNLFNKMNGGLESGMAGAGLVGLMNAYPQLKQFIYNHVDAKDKERLDQFVKPNQCMGKGLISNAHTDFLKLVKVNDPLDTPTIKSVLARESLLMNVSTVGIGVPTFPRLIYNAAEDEIARLSIAELYVNQQCQHGANIQFKVVPLAFHVLAGIEGAPHALTFLGQMFNHATPRVKCGTTELIENQKRNARAIQASKHGVHRAKLHRSY